MKLSAILVLCTVPALVGAVLALTVAVMDNNARLDSLEAGCAALESQDD